MISYDDKVAFVRALLKNAFNAADEKMDTGLFVEREKRQRKPQPKSIRVAVAGTTVTIKRCYHECPHFGLEGGPGPIMVCEHPSLRGKGIEAAAIISHPDCDTGFPEECPLLSAS